jgi:hypothetical protein
MIDFVVVDIVDIVDIVDFGWIIENLWKRVDIYFSYSKYIILGIIGERERFYGLTRNFNNNNYNNIRNELKVATMKFFGNYKFLYFYVIYK